MVNLARFPFWKGNRVYVHQQTTNCALVTIGQEGMANSISGKVLLKSIYATEHSKNNNIFMAC
jgi:hypothetical protein